jgi:tetratricopeptide (TPR) repeat protein
MHRGRAAPAPPMPPQPRVRSGAALLVGVCLTWGTGAAPGQAQRVEEVQRELAQIEGDAHQLGTMPLRQTQLRSPTYVEERLTDGELFFRLQDYPRASIIFTDIVENHEGHRAYPDAVFLLGESLFHAGDYLGARTRFRSIIDRGAESRFGPYLQRSLGRLIEVAIHVRDFSRVEEHFQQLGRLTSGQVEASTAYFKAKYLFSKATPGDEPLDDDGAPAAGVDLAGLEQARKHFASVTADSPYHPQALYFIGTIHTLRGEYPKAVEAFKKVLGARSTTPEHREVVDLTHLALGRLYYETDRIPQAVEAYHAVQRTSPLFDTALFEAAWAYIRLGDSTRAERALEVLSVAVPDSPHIPDAKLLRGNLLMRNGRLEDSNEVFVEIREQFVPVRRELDEMIANREDVQAHFRRLVRDNLASFDAAAFLPEDARRYAAVSPDLDRALNALSDLSHARQLVRETHDLIERLNGAISSQNQRGVFPDLRRHIEVVTRLRNRAAKARRALMSIEERRVPTGRAGELAQVREQRRRIERMLGGMPTDDDDFVLRDDELRGRYRALARELGQLRVELLGMDARVTATRRYVDDTAAERDPEGVAATMGELAHQGQAIDDYRERIVELERDIETARLQVGVGDARYRRDDQLRDEYSQLVERERQLLASMGGRGLAETDALFGRLTKVESILNRHEAKVHDIADARIGEIRRVLDEERGNLEGYRERMAALEDESESVVGGIAFESFNEVRERFYTLILRADVGRIDVAWARREEHRMRVDMLTRDRAREVRALDDEFREIMDESRSTEEGQ